MGNRETVKYCEILLNELKGIFLCQPRLALSVKRGFLCQPHLTS